MGSTDTPSSSSNPANQLQHEQQQYDSNLSSTELANLLEQKDREIYALKFELEKYKLALHQSQLGHRYFQQQQQIHEHESETLAKDNVDSLINSDQFEQKPALVDALTLSSTQVFLGDVVDRSVDAQHKKLLAVGDSEEVSEFGTDEHSVSKISSSQSTRLPLNRQSIASACSNMSGSSSKVVFEAGADEDDELDDVCSMSQAADDDERDMSENIVGDIVSDDLQDIIQDVGEIDLDLEFDSNRVEDSCYRSISSDQMPRQPNKHSDVPMTGNINGGGDDADDDDDDDGDHDADDDGENDQGSNEDVGGNVITDGLLTSFTDAAINNLSQLAALQERCESQQHSQYQNHQHSKTESTDTIESTQQPKSLTSSQLTDHQAFVPTNPVPPPRRSSTSGPVGLGSIDRTSSLSMNIGARDVQGPCVGFHLEDRFPSSAQATQATAAAVAALANKLQNSTSMIGHLNKTDLLSSSVSPNSSSRLQVDHGGGRSLASVVAAAAAAAVAAANSNHNHHQHHNRPTHQIQSTPQSRLISSALPTSEFYRNLQQQQQQHQQLPHAHQISPVSSIHFSPSTSITPSPLFGQSRRSASNTSSSLLSPIASPSYLKRQFMPDRLLMMSPSPTSLTTGSNSCNSSSLAQILQQHHLGQQHQQRSATALGGTISSPSGTSISGTGSAAMSPLMSSKNSSQARLNNMQIRHKFGYLGSTRAQFNSPHGFCLGLNQEIVVADTNNHRIAIFDNTGTYISQFGAAGKEEGQLWNPRKVAILHRPTNGGVGSGGGGNGSVGSSLQQRQGQITAASTTTSVSSDHFASEPLFVVCDRGAERSRMQLFTKDGAFIKKIGIHYIDIVAGLAITQDGLIIVVDSVSPTVYIINGETGSLNGWFDCSGHMKEPSDIAVKSEASRNEYFICDFKGHCVVVFSEQGDYLRKIGHDGLTSYPNGIDISDDGDILVGDSHGNRFHVVVFDRNGNFVSQFECPHVKVSRCCGLKITREGYIVTLAKNNHHVLVLDTIHI